jgi:hypothetical protein
MEVIKPKTAKKVKSKRRATAIIPIALFLRRRQSYGKLVVAGISINLNSISNA